MTILGFCYFLCETHKTAAKLLCEITTGIRYNKLRKLKKG